MQRVGGMRCLPPMSGRGRHQSDLQAMMNDGRFGPTLVQGRGIPIHLPACASASKTLRHSPNHFALRAATRLGLAPIAHPRRHRAAGGLSLA